MVLWAISIYMWSGACLLASGEHMKSRKKQKQWSLLCPHTARTWTPVTLAWRDGFSYTRGVGKERGGRSRKAEKVRFFCSYILWPPRRQVARLSSWLRTRIDIGWLVLDNY
jgi:hypothetical protein